MKGIEEHLLYELEMVTGGTKHFVVVGEGEGEQELYVDSENLGGHPPYHHFREVQTDCGSNL